MTENNTNIPNVENPKLNTNEKAAGGTVPRENKAAVQQAAPQQAVPSQPYPPVVITKRPAQSFDRRDAVFAVLALALGAFTYEFAIQNEFRSGLTAAHFLMLIIGTVYFGKSRRRISPYPVFCGIASLALGSLFSIVNSELLALCFAAMVFTEIVYFFSIWGQPRHPLGSYSTVFDFLRYSVFLPLSKLTEPFRAFLNKSGKKLKKTPKILLGALIALPVLCVVVPLLISSDAAFEGLMLAVWEDIMEIIARIIVTLLIFVFVFSFMFAVNKKLDVTETAPLKINTHIADSTVVNTALLLLSFIYAVYMLSQLSYFFSAFSGLLPEDFTFAEYARRGFFEMCAIAAVNLGLMFLSLVLSKYRDKKISKLTKALCLFIGAFSILLIATSFSKMYMYISQYGLTRLRVITSAFMVVLLLVFVYTVIRIFKARFPYMKFAVVTACIVLFSLTLADVDRCVAKFNIYAYRSGITEELDMDMLGWLGSGSTPELMKLIDDENDKIKYDAINCLLDRSFVYFDVDEHGNIKEQGRTKIMSFNLSEYREKKVSRDFLEMKKDELKELTKKTAELNELNPAMATDF